MSRQTSPFTLTSAFYFYLFFSIGSTSPFFAVWFKSIGITEKQVGIIAASPSFAMLATTVFIGAMADQAKDWRTTIIICNWLVALLITGLFLADGFVHVLIIWTLVGILMMAMSPILDAAAIRMARHQNTQYHRMRAFGSAGFIAGVLLAGILFDRLGIGFFVVVITTLSWLRALLSLSLPRFKSGIDPVEVPSAATTADTPMTYRKLWFLLVLLGSAMIHASHAYYYTFGTVMWIESGYSTTTASVLWALGVIIEVAVMWRFATFAKRFSARVLLIYAGLTAALRWIVFGFNPEFAVLLIAQLLHGLTFGIMFLATINFITNWTPVHIAARAQTLSATLNTALMALTTVGSGLLQSLVTEQGYWLMAVMCALAMALIGLSFRLSPDRSGS